MIRLTLSLLLICSIAFSIELDYAIEDTNIITNDRDKTENYNRLRVNFTIEEKKYENIIIKIIADNENFYNHKTESNINENSLYRGYFKYTDETHLLSIGLQRIPFGVGHIWNPIDIFNPINSTSAEPQIREGTESLRYEYAINPLSNLSIAYSKQKSSLKIKSYLDFADFALVALKLNKYDEKKDILGYEIEGSEIKSKIKTITNI